MKAGRVALLLAAAAVLEFFVGRSPYRRFLPIDWFLLATAVVARSGDFVRAVLAGAAAGALEDALSMPLIGLNAFAKAILGNRRPEACGFSLPVPARPDGATKSC